MVFRWNSELHECACDERQCNAPKIVWIREWKMGEDKQKIEKIISKWTTNGTRKWKNRFYSFVWHFRIEFYHSSHLDSSRLVSLPSSFNNENFFFVFLIFFFFILSFVLDFSLVTSFRLQFLFGSVSVNLMTSVSQLNIVPHKF